MFACATATPACAFLKSASLAAKPMRQLSDSCQVARPSTASLANRALVTRARSTFAWSCATVASAWTGAASVWASSALASAS
jgi:hypothetical protein